MCESEPTTYTEIYQNYPYPDLIRVRDQLVKDVIRYETQADPLVRLMPNNETEKPYAEYMKDLLHLAEICLMIYKVYPEEIEAQLKEITHES